MKINEKHRMRVEERGYGYLGTYKRYEYTNDKHIYNKNCSYVRVKCPYCEIEYDVHYSGFVNNKQNCSHCCNKYENSFAYHIQVELKESLNKYWDWDKNTLNPYLITKCNNKKIWIKCANTDYHDSYLTNCANFKKGKRCSYCMGRKINPKDSFAQYHINNTDKNFIEKYWSEKNKINPWRISKNNINKVWIKCQKKDYHDDYLVTCAGFTYGTRCAQCSNRNGKTHPLDSFGSLYPDKAKYWSENNEASPFHVAPKSGKKYKFICEECGIEFERMLSDLNRVNTGVKCINCNSSKGEQRLKEWLDNNNFIQGEDYIYQKEFKGLVGLKGGNLSYDFYLPKYNILIEYQGEQHYSHKKGFIKTKENFEWQLKHDQRKFNYAVNNNINILYIYDWQYDEMRNILKYELQI